MTKEEYLKTVRKQIHFIFDRDKIEEELNQHLTDHQLDFMEEGFSQEEAEKLAVSHMGDAIEVGKLLNQQHHPVLGYLWLFSNILIGLAIVPIIILLLYTGYTTVQLSTPTVLKESVETYVIDIKQELPTHTIYIDRLCVNDEGDYYLTFRAWTNYPYSRAGWSSDFFMIEDEEDHYLSRGAYYSNGLFGCYGYKCFDKPTDQVIYLNFVDGQEIILDLGDYINETHQTTHH